MVNINIYIKINFLSMKDDKIDNLSNKIDELLGYSKDIKEQNEDLSIDINELTFKVEEVREEFKVNIEYINPPLDDTTKIHMFTLLQYKNETNKFKIIRGQDKYLTNKITNEMNVIIEKKYNPNPIDLFTTFKDRINDNNNIIKQNIMNNRKLKLITTDEKRNLLQELREEPPIKITYNTITINIIKSSIDELLQIINECDDIRRNTKIP